jgi:sugar/nucleoside kinase (ribokinase family)
MDQEPRPDQRVRAGLDILVVGDANPDLVLRGDVRPRFGQAEQLLDAADLVLGGSATITACGCARLGLRTAMVARVGADLFGDHFRDTLTHHGVRTDHLYRDTTSPTGLSVILSTAGDRAILTLPGAMAALRADDVPDAALVSARHLHVGGVFLLPALLDGLASLFARAKAHGLTTSLDTNWDPAQRWSGLSDALAHTDFLFPNAAELLALTGRGTDDLDRPEGSRAVEAAAADLVAQGVAVVLKDGPRGGRAWWPGGTCVAEPPRVEVVDTTGAGDSFNAGFLAGHLSGLPLPRCVEYAATAGSLSTRAAGGTAAQPTLAELRAAVASR